MLPFSGTLSRFVVKTVRRNKSVKMKICAARNAYIVSGICEKYQNKFYNSAILVRPDGKVITYRKIHLFSDEKSWFEPGNIFLQAHVMRKQKHTMAFEENPNVLAMWDKFFAVCECVPLKTLAESNEMFAGFEPIPATAAISQTERTVRSHERTFICANLGKTIS